MGDGDQPKASLPIRRTAFLIVHGVGQQNKFETLSGFAAGLAIHLKRRTGQTCQIQRHLQQHGDWNDSVLRLGVGDSGALIDVAEYYYQPALQRQVELEDVIDWLLSASRRIRKLYRTTPFLKARLAESRTGADGVSDGLGRGYMLMGAAWLLPLIIHGIGWLLPKLKSAATNQWLVLLHPVLRLLVSIAYGFIANRLDDLIKNFAGDVTAYTAIDPKLKLNRVRQDILDGCVEKIEALAAQQQDGQPLYDQIVVASHSLGTVVAYDALSRISNNIVTGHGAISQTDAKRLVGLVTFGSPLDKIALFFWPVNEDLPATTGNSSSGPGNTRQDRADWQSLKANLQTGMLAHFHGMRGLRREIADYPSAVVEQVGHPLEHVLWLNFFHPRDLIAGHLDAFVGVTNIETFGADRGDPPFPEAHSFYWYDDRMLQTVIHFFLEQDATGLMGAQNREIREQELGALRAVFRPVPEIRTSGTSANATS